MELEGVEPSSKQGNHTLSTCLFRTWFSCCDKTRTTHRQPYLLKLHLPTGASRRLFPIFLHRLILRFGTTSLERCLVPLPGRRIKPVIYCTSIRQRERSCFRQLIVRPNGLWSLQPSLRMLTYHLVLPSNPVKPKYDIAVSGCKDTKKQDKNKINRHLFSFSSKKAYSALRFVKSP